MILAIEDSLSEAVLRKLVMTVRPTLQIDGVVGHRGKTYLRTRCRELNRVAGRLPVIIVIDQDTPRPCPADLIRDWLGAPARRHLVFRVAVASIESWVIADRSAAAQALGVSPGRIPQSTDEIEHPKRFLVNLARRSRLGRVREDLVPSPGSTAQIGPAYNATLRRFVADACFCRWR